MGVHVRRGRRFDVYTRLSASRWLRLDCVCPTAAADAVPLQLTSKTLDLRDDGFHFAKRRGWPLPP